eukprot:3958447-Pyramimonas_sp.AAC.1
MRAGPTGTPGRRPCRKRRNSIVSAQERREATSSQTGLQTAVPLICTAVAHVESEVHVGKSSRRAHRATHAEVLAPKRTAA